MSETTITPDQKDLLEKEIKSLEAKLTGDMFQDMEIRDKIHNINLKLKGVRPSNSEIECVGCGS